MIVSNTPKEMNMNEFDKEVRALRGTVEAKSIPKRKAQCTPAEWAMNLDYQMGQGRIRRRRTRQRLARAKAKRTVAKPMVVKMPAPKPVPQPPVKQETVMMFLKMAKHLATGNEPLVEVLTMVEKLVSLS
jgi:hypothetical protein